MENDATQIPVFLATLWRGGTHSYYWSSGGKASQWTPTQPITPCVLGQRNTYMGVHPTGAPRGRHERARITDVAAINCLFAEFDAKDERYGSIPAIRSHIQTLEAQPQVIVYSGGGYHAYWFFNDPVPLTENGLEYLRGIQAAWVTMCGGDPGAKDLARILRLPGTFNAKYAPMRKVEFVRFNLTETGGYDPAQLCEMAEPFWPEQARIPASDLPAPVGNHATALTRGMVRGVVEFFAESAEGERNHRLLWSACRLNEHGLSESEMIAELIPVALRVGLTEHESIATIRSAIKQPPRAGVVGKPVTTFGNAQPDMNARAMRVQDALRP